jgi:alanyl-tRNA synthetase
MNRVFLSGISAIAGGAIVHVTEKETMNQLKGKNDEYKRLVKRLIDELNRKNRKIRELEKKVNKEKEEKEETNNIDVKQTLNLEIDSSDTSDSFEELDQKKEDSFPGVEVEAEVVSQTEEESGALLEEAESSTESSKSESKSESVDMSSSVSFG